MASAGTDLLHGLGQIISAFCAPLPSAFSCLSYLLSLDCKFPKEAFSLCAYGQWSSAAAPVHCYNTNTTSYHKRKCSVSYLVKPRSW